jgi:hypothetical protein
MLCPALGRRTAHHNLIVRIPDGAVVDRYQESIDLERDCWRLNRLAIPNRSGSDSRCWLDGGQHLWPALIRLIFVNALLRL